MRVVVIFIDGMGLGELSPDNPLAFAETPSLTALLQGNALTREMEGFRDERASLCALDARLGVPGLPQSATGQASLFTGVNAPCHLGRHLNGFPNPPLRSLLEAEGFFAAFRKAGYSCAFINAYSPPFFKKIEQGPAGRRFSCSTLITYYAGLPFYNIDDLAAGDAIFMDLTNERLNKMGFAVPLITPEEAGKRLIDIASRFDFSLFEYFITDYAGHRADREEAARVIGILDRFFGAAVERLNPRETLLVITSDHGNIEDLTHGSHTLNPVPALMIGAESVRRQIEPLLHDLTDLKGALEQVLEIA